MKRYTFSEYLIQNIGNLGELVMGFPNLDKKGFMCKFPIN